MQYINKSDAYLSDEEKRIVSVIDSNLNYFNNGKTHRRVNRMKVYDLPAIADARNTFYGKATIVEDDKGKHLLSYGSQICDIDNDGNVHINTDIDKWDSSTSIRHIRSFLEFFNKPNGTKKEIIKMYVQ